MFSLFFKRIYISVISIFIFIFIVLFPHTTSTTTSTTTKQTLDKSLIVNTKWGRIHGIRYPSNYTLRNEMTRNPISHDLPVAYLGIPFAKAPIGPLRFMNPVPYSQHYPAENKDIRDMGGNGDGILMAQKTGSMCLQVLTVPFLGISEDCLYLNVFTPSTNRLNHLRSTSPIPKKLPVMFWIFGGAFSFGSGGTGGIKDANPYSGSYVTSQKDVIIVTFNHRLGGTGFLTTDYVNGNMGIMDVKEAYRWTVDNIESFGGDKDEITVFGMSSGAYLALLLAMDPTLPPVKRVISMSPPSGMKPKKREVAREGGNSYLKAVGCLHKDSDVVSGSYRQIECLQKLNAFQLMLGTIVSDQKWLSNAITNPLKWLPIADDSIFIGRPLDIIDMAKSNTQMRDRIAKTEFIMGVAKHEAALFVAVAEGFGMVPGGTLFVLKGKETWWQFLLDLFFGDWTLANRISLELWRKKPNFAERQYINAVNMLFMEDEDLTKKVLVVYPPRLKIEDNVDKIVELLTDYMFTCPSLYMARKLKEYTKNVRMYEFAHEPEWTRPVIGRGGRFNRTAIAHALDVLYFWNYFPVLPAGDQKVARMYTDYFSAFASGDVNNQCSSNKSENPIQNHLSQQPQQQQKQHALMMDEINDEDCRAEGLPRWDEFEGPYGPVMTFGIPEKYGSMLPSLRADVCKFWDTLPNPYNKEKPNQPYEF